MVNRKWDSQMDANSCITFGEWNRMVSWLKNLHDYMQNSYPTVGDLDITEWNEVITVNNLCDKITTLCPNVITTDSLCSAVETLCDIQPGGGICAESAQSNIFGATSVWNIFHDCDGEDSIEVGIIKNIIGGGDYSQTIIHGGLNYEGAMGSHLNQSLILLPLLDIVVDSEITQVEEFFADKFPRLLLNDSVKTFALGLFLDMDMETDSVPTLRSNPIECRVSDGMGAGEIFPFFRIQFEAHLNDGWSRTVLESIGIAGAPGDKDLYLKTPEEGFVQFGEYTELYSEPTITGYIRMKTKSGKVIRVYCYVEEEGGGGAPPP